MGYIVSEGVLSFSMSGHAVLSPPRRRVRIVAIIRRIGWRLREAKEAHDRRIAAAWRDDRMLTDSEAADALDGAMRAFEQTLARAIRRNRDR